MLSAVGLPHVTQQTVAERTEMFTCDFLKAFQTQCKRYVQFVPSTCVS